MLLGKGEEATGGRNRDSITSDVMEAVIGALYLDGGFDAAHDFIQRFILSDLENKILFYDSKTVLQEILQAEGDGEFSYELKGEEGPDHNKSFWVHVASQLDIPCAVRKRWLTDHRGTQLRKLSFRHLRILMEKKIAGNQLQHSISQKLQPLVVL